MYNTSVYYSCMRISVCILYDYICMCSDSTDHMYVILCIYYAYLCVVYHTCVLRTSTQITSAVICAVYDVTSLDVGCMPDLR